ncbi:MMPL family transporter, partial [Candidatus Poribacteria bacterium]|nr:MMPL family transporter [Candidatus Poribacteria bacterium]
LTLPGLAGLVLTIGMAVDANVLINERIKEELRTGKTVASAITAGYGRVFWTIFDANLTTFLTALVLYMFGTGAIKGFGVTLMIGIVASMFTALFVARTFYRIFESRGRPRLPIYPIFSGRQS